MYRKHAIVKVIIINVLCSSCAKISQVLKTTRKCVNNRHVVRQVWCLSSRLAQFYSQSWPTTFNTEKRQKIQHVMINFHFSNSSRNKRTSDRGKVSLANVARAIRDIKLQKMTVRAAAQCYSVPRTTLRRHLEKVSSAYEDISNVTDEELQETMKRLGTYAACAVKQVS